jgi:hypothetical protein
MWMHPASIADLRVLVWARMASFAIQAMVTFFDVEKCDGDHLLMVSPEQFVTDLE